MATLRVYIPKRILLIAAILLFLAVIVLSVVKCSSSGGVAPIDGEEKPEWKSENTTEEPFPSDTKIFELLQSYARCVENRDEDALLPFYAPYLEEYFNYLYARREEVVDDIFDEISMYAYVNELKVTVLLPSVIIEPLTETKVQVSFMIVIDDKEPDFYTQNLILFKKWVLNDSYQIICEEYERYDDSEGEPDWDYSPGNREWQDGPEEDNPNEVPIGYIQVPAGMSIQEAIYEKYPWLRQYEDAYGVGGAKVIGEESADRDHKTGSRYDYEDIEICIYPTVVLRLCQPSDPDFIYNQVCNNHIWIPDCIIDSDGYGEFTVTVILCNRTDEPQTVVVPQGTMFEAVKENVQHVAANEEVVAVVPANETRRMDVSAVCASHYRGSPVGSRARVTPFALTEPKSRYYSSYSQQSVWEHQEAEANNRMVFYIWGRNRRFPDGHVSLMGHAFVYVPGVGYVGYGHRSDVPHSVAYVLSHKMDGVVFDHREKRQFATDSCVVYLTDTQLKNVRTLLQSRMLHTPPYRLAKNDCTSFVMDVADAAGIYYGYRRLIQTPERFMRQLKKYNDYRKH